MTLPQDQNPYRPPPALKTDDGKINWHEVGRWSWFGAASGAGVPTFFVIIFVVATVASGVREQGQLFHEDGPVAFFFISFVLWLIFLIPAAITGAGVGAFLGLLREVSWSPSNR